MVTVTPDGNGFFGLTAALIAHAPTRVKVVDPFADESSSFFATLWAATGEDIGHVLQIAEDRGSTRILDIGSGDGRLVEALARRGISALGVELSASMHTRAKSRLARLPEPVRSHARSLNLDLRALPRTPGAVDAVASIGLTVSTFDPELRSSFFRLAHDLLPPGGDLIFDLLDVDHTDDESFFTEMHRPLSDGRFEVVLLDCLHRPSRGFQQTNILFQRIGAHETHYVASALRCEIVSRPELVSELKDCGFDVESVEAVGVADPEGAPVGTDPGWGISRIVATRA